MKDALLEAVKGLTYKPGWTFAVEDYMGLGLDDRIIALNIKVDTVCIDSGEPITIDRSFPATGGRKSDLADFLGMITPIAFQAESFVAMCIEEIEKHEVHEWLKFSGKRHYPEVHGSDGY